MAELVGIEAACKEIEQHLAKCGSSTRDVRHVNEITWWCRNYVVALTLTVDHPLLGLREGSEFAALWG